jgi:hypothetical protein
MSRVTLREFMRRMARKPFELTIVDPMIGGGMS